MVEEVGLHIKIRKMIGTRTILGLQTDKFNQNPFITRSPSVTFGDSFLPEEAFRNVYLFKQLSPAKSQFIFRFICSPSVLRG